MRDCWNIDDGWLLFYEGVLIKHTKHNRAADADSTEFMLMPLISSRDYVWGYSSRNLFIILLIDSQVCCSKQAVTGTETVLIDRLTHNTVTPWTYEFTLQHTNGGNCCSTVLCSVVL